MDSNFGFRERRNQEIQVSRRSSTDLVYGTVARISAEPSGRQAREQYRADKCPVDGEGPSREAAVLRAITNMSAIRDRSVVRSSAGRLQTRPGPTWGPSLFAGPSRAGLETVPVLADRTLPAPYPPDKMICPAAQRPPGSSSQWTPSWREQDSNPRSPGCGLGAS